MKIQLYVETNAILFRENPTGEFRLGPFINVSQELKPHGFQQKMAADRASCKCLKAQFNTARGGESVATWQMREAFQLQFYWKQGRDFEVQVIPHFSWESIQSRMKMPNYNSNGSGVSPIFTATEG